MKASNTCPKCGSNQIIADAKAVDRGESDFQRDLSVATYRKPEALIFKGKQSTSLSAWVCVTCGYIELYADAPTSLILKSE